MDVDEIAKPIAFADLVDSVLINYGNAYSVDSYMTNMSNLAMMGGNSSMAMVDMADKNNSNNSSSMNIGSMNMTPFTMMNMNSKTNRNYSLVD
jgi:hypothetical protein